VERVCFLARVRPDRLDEYRERHKSVWAEMREALAKAGWGNYSIFLAEDGLLIGYLETDDYQAALNAMAATDVNKRWQAEMSDFFVADGLPDQSFLRIAEIFHLDLAAHHRRAPAARSEFRARLADAAP
jgi:L-rhamnose mutarotase